MKCRRVRKKIYGYLYGYLNAFETSKVEKHLLSCQECAKEFASATRTLQLTVNLPTRYPSAEAWSSFLPDLHRRIELEFIENSNSSKWSSILSVLSPENLKFAAALGALILSISSASYSGFKAISYYLSSKPTAQIQVKNLSKSFSNMRQTEYMASIPGTLDDLISEETGTDSTSTLFKQIAHGRETEQYISTPLSVSEAIDQSSLILIAYE